MSTQNPSANEPIKTKPNLNMGLLESISFLYIGIEILKTLQYYIGVINPLELAELTACSVVSGYAKAKGKQEATERLDPAILDTIFEETLSKHKNLTSLINQLSEHCGNVYLNHKKKLQKDLAKLEKANALENSFLGSYKLNHTAIYRVFTNELLRNADDTNSENILALKVALTASIMASTTIIREGSIIAGERAGITLEHLTRKMRSYLDKEYQKTFDSMANEFTKTMHDLGTIAYASFQIYKICSKVSKKGIQVFLLPLNGMIIASSGVLTGMTETYIHDRKANTLFAFDTSEKQEWNNFYNTMLLSSSGLCSDIVRDWQTSYNLAISQQIKTFNASSEGFTQVALLQPKKQGRELLLYTMIAQQENSSVLQNPIINFDVHLTAAYEAVLGTASKYTFLAGKKAGGLLGKGLQLITTKSTNPNASDKYL